MFSIGAPRAAGARSCAQFSDFFCQTLLPATPETLIGRDRTRSLAHKAHNGVLAELG
jgi:hypothetical protein